MNITIRPSLILEFIGSREEHFSKIIIYKLISNGAIHYPIWLSRVVRSRVLGRIFFFTALNHPPPIEQNPPPGRNQEDHPPPGRNQEDPPWRNQEDLPSPSSACWEIRSTSGRYASYWNAYLFSSYFSGFSFFVLHGFVLIRPGDDVSFPQIHWECDTGVESLSIPYHMMLQNYCRWKHVQMSVPAFTE